MEGKAGDAVQMTELRRDFKGIRIKGQWTIL